MNQVDVIPGDHAKGVQISVGISTKAHYSLSFRCFRLLECQSVTMAFFVSTLRVQSVLVILMITY